MKQSAVVKEDLFRMRVRLSRAAVKAIFLLAVHLHFGLMPPLVVSCVTAVVALPYWWDRESSYIAKCGPVWNDAIEQMQYFISAQVWAPPRPAGMGSVCGSTRRGRRLRLITS